jgi:hypothetical protein
VTIVRQDNVPLPPGVLLDQAIMPSAVVSPELTKTSLGMLPEGAYIVSNGLNPRGQLFAEKLGSVRERQSLWDRAKAAGATGRKCHVAWTEEEFEFLRPKVGGHLRRR